MRFQVSEKDRKALCRQAPEFREIAGKTEIDGFECPGDPFHALVQSILSQQLSVKAADTIHRRVERLLGTVSPETLDAAAPDALPGSELLPPFRQCLPQRQRRRL